MITRHPWFGTKKYIGWGWRPISWEGWAVTILWLASVFAAHLLMGATPAFTAVAIGLVVLLLVICWLTGLPPG
jgi:hypothetical protein